LSSNLAYVLPTGAPRTDREKPRRLVEVVPTRAQRAARPRPIYAIITVASLFVLFIVQLLLSITLSQGAYEITALQNKHADLSRSEQSLTEKVDLLASTQNLAKNAEALGMVLSTTTPAFLNLTDGEVIGKTRVAGKASDGVLGSAGSLVPNALLGDAGLDDAVVGPNAPPAPASSSIEPTTPEGTPAAEAVDPGSATVFAEDGTPVSAGGAVLDDPAEQPQSSVEAGAPAVEADDSSVPSVNGLPTPITR
jgi:hypothetical protein